MPVYTLVEYKLRRYIYLGHEYSYYVPSSIRKKCWPEKFHEDVTGIRIIGRIVNKNDSIQINSIVPILLKIKKEDKLHDDRLLIFLLAVCTKFKLYQCTKMVTDACAAVSSICTDGLKILMFVKFCKTANYLLYKLKYIPNLYRSFGADINKVLNEWYLNRDPMLTVEQITRHSHYGGWNHKDVMKFIKLHSNDPRREIYIVYVIYGMKKVEELFKSKLDIEEFQSDDEIVAHKQFKCVYNYLESIVKFRIIDDETLENKIKTLKLGNEFEIIPIKRLKSLKVLTAMVMHMPLATLLDNTFRFAKRRFFIDVSSTEMEGIWAFISRFSNKIELKNSGIHPIEPFLQYIKYSRNISHILKIKNNIWKKQINPETLDIMLDDESVNNSYEWVKEISESNDLNNQTINKASEISENKDNVTQLCEEHDSKFHQVGHSKSNRPNFETNFLNNSSELNKNEKTQNDSKKGKSTKNNILIKTESKTIRENKEEQMRIQLSQLSTENNENKLNIFDNMTQNKLNTVLTKPLSKLSEPLKTFLSKELVTKTLENLKSSGYNMLIAYDNQTSLKEKYCYFSHLINVREAITLTILSLIYPENSQEDKPTVLGFDELKKGSYEVKIDYNKPLNFADLEYILYKSQNGSKSKNHKIISAFNPKSVVNWAKVHNKKSDVFIFLGTNKMNLKDMNMILKQYQTYLKKPVKVIVCCLNGKHSELSNLGRRHNVLFIIGFDKNIGKVIKSFLNEEF